MIVKNGLQDIFVPNFDEISKLTCDDGTIHNELDVIRKSSAHSGLFDDLLREIPPQFDSEGNDNNDFNSIIPKEVQSTVELMQYANFVKDK